MATLEFLAITNLLLSAKNAEKRQLPSPLQFVRLRREGVEIPFPKNSFLRGEKHVFIGACD